jgi:uncharacterized protein
MSLLLEKAEKGFLSLFVILIFLVTFTSYTYAQGPSFDCSKVEAGSIEETICKDPALSALDRKMATVYKEAEKKAVNETPPVLKAEQRGWIKGRNDCWKSEDVKECIKLNYTLRIAELEARYALVTSTGPFFYACDGNPANEVVMTFYETDPSTLVAEYGDSTSLMYIEPSGSGSKYQGRNESVWIKGNEARVKWGVVSQTMNCKKKL